MSLIWRFIRLACTKHPDLEVHLRIVISLKPLSLMVAKVIKRRGSVLHWECFPPAAAGSNPGSTKIFSLNSLVHEQYWDWTHQVLSNRFQKSSLRWCPERSTTKRKEFFLSLQVEKTLLDRPRFSLDWSDRSLGVEVWWMGSLIIEATKNTNFSLFLAVVSWQGDSTYSVVHVACW